jgi:hypothetical protein
VSNIVPIVLCLLVTAPVRHGTYSAQRLCCQLDFDRRTQKRAAGERHQHLGRPGPEPPLRIRVVGRAMTEAVARIPGAGLAAARRPVR